MKWIITKNTLDLITWRKKKKTIDSLKLWYQLKYWQGFLQEKSMQDKWILMILFEVEIFEYETPSNLYA